ncbi:MAG: ADP-forming succinate--CoA ligase subunit beta [Pseudomonadota bacterium]
MNIHEYQGKAILKKYGVSVPRGKAVFTASEAKAVADELIKETGNQVVVVKAQIHAGGRGKGRFKEDPEHGGVNVVKGSAEVAKVAERMLGKTLVTHQTGEAGRVVNRLLIEQGINIEREVYVGAVVDRVTQRIAMMACAEGGVEIETVAARSPEKILKEWIDPVVGLAGYQARKLAFGLGLSGVAHTKATQFMIALAKAFDQEDASLAEINPLVVTKDGEVMALDAKLNLDETAEFRHPVWAELRDTSEEEPSEMEAKKFDLSYVKLDGNIGCMVNGAGLAMATMDIIKHFDGEPANFLDVGGAADKDRVTAAFKIILSDPNVKGIFVNIFGGIVHCDIVAQGVVAAVKEMGLKVPLVVRLEGTNVEVARKILSESKLNVTPAQDMADGARKIVEAAK